ncbi:phytanoyl-CoA dioxygenase family protein [Roseomonas sp. SSH11]|uniref:Phytanoyl-CoA dioxygenase family protein n=1 Tax=Pararoseomonas baculiformis TaxID=2820812 RepID=A0ABS4AAV1_9PROT|nr:phytanoyl-CoA dioxygenase family protein [Pararoseomonas baculiformis]MBP0444123.1 phytanoyl-CoA dioxygenase family protein [Pararoseomonas baculiformis]
MDAMNPAASEAAHFRYLMAIRGWVRFPALIAPGLLGALREELDECYATWRAIQLRNGVAEATDGTLHHLAGRGGAVDRFLAGLPLHDEITGFLGGGPYVLNACGAYLNRPDTSAYVGRIHRDVRGFSAPYVLMINMLVMLDDFTEENGASWMLSGSHHHPDRPPDEVFLAHAERNTGRAGDVVLFDSHLWHCAGVNRSAAPRRALTIGYTRPFVKPQMDYTRMGPEPRDEALRQLLGFNARVPDSLDAYYQPPERRSYRADQG